MSTYSWLLISDEDFEKSKWSDSIKFKCSTCNNISFRTKSSIRNSILAHGAKRISCSNKCSKTKPKISVICRNCEVQFDKIPSQVRDNNFCSKSCSAIYNNAHKTHGSTRSKLEIWIESQLLALYPNLDIHFNRKDTINSELDIYIPALKLAFELNGIYHYEPIHGSEILERIQNNDNRKFQACLEQGIELCIIDSSNQKRFTESGSQKYLDIILGIISLKVT